MSTGKFVAKGLNLPAAVVFLERAHLPDGKLGTKEKTKCCGKGTGCRSKSECGQNRYVYKKMKESEASDICNRVNVTSSTSAK